MSMPIPATAIKSFYIFSESWYSDSDGLLRKGIVDEIMIGMSEPNEGTYGEFGIEFKYLGSHLSAKLVAFGDSWLVLSQMPELMELMAANGNSSNESIKPVSWWKEQLIALGYTDITSRERDR